MAGKNIRIDDDTHKLLIEFIEKTDKKVGKFSAIAIREKIIKEQEIIKKKND